MTAMEVSLLGLVCVEVGNGRLAAGPPDWYL